MRAVLVGADLMYRQNGALVPIEINTNVGWDYLNRVEEDLDDIFDLSEFKSFLNSHNLEEIWVDGILAPILVSYFSAKGLQAFIKSKEVLQGEEVEGVLFLRTSYSEEAIVDSFCKDKAKFLRSIRNTEIGSEFILKTSEGIEGRISTFPDNGDYPNFILKYRYPYYNHSIYPKLVKLTGMNDLVKFLVSEEFEEDYILMPFYYNESKLVSLGGSRIPLIRELCAFVQENNSLRAISLGHYTKLGGDLTGVECEYNEEKVLVQGRDSFLTNWTETGKGDVLAEEGDLVLMADDTWKPVEELAVGDVIKTLDLPTSGDVDLKKHSEDYNVSFEELAASSSYGENRIVILAKNKGIVTKVNLQFTDGTDWWDTANSSYPTIDPEDGTVWFRELKDLEAGDKVILLEADSLMSPTYVEKEIESVEVERNIIEGYQLTTNGSHLFITRYPGESGAYASIEHNTVEPCDGSSSGSPCSSADKTSYSTQTCVTRIWSENQDFNGVDYMVTIASWNRVTEFYWTNTMPVGSGNSRYMYWYGAPLPDLSFQVQISGDIMNTDYNYYTIKWVLSGGGTETLTYTDEGFVSGPGYSYPNEIIFY